MFILTLNVPIFDILTLNVPIFEIKPSKGHVAVVSPEFSFKRKTQNEKNLIILLQS